MCTYKASASNLKEVTYDSTYGGLKVTGVYGPGYIWGGETEQSLGIVTFDGRLHMVQCSYKPLTGLLEAVQQLVEAAVSTS